MRSLLTLTLASLGLAADCTRPLLQAGADALVAAQTAGNPALLTPASASLVYTENQKAATLANGILKTALKPDHVRSSLDTTQCATYTEIIVAKGAKPYVIGVQMRWDADHAAIAQVDSLVTTTGDWLFNATGTLYWASQEKWDTIPEEKRDSREVIQAAGDAYCDIFNDKSVKVPWGTPCARLEGGSYTGKGKATDSCNVGIPSGVTFTQRKYIIDETVGAVDIMVHFNSLPDSHEFRVEGGKLRFVHTITVMGKGKKREAGGITSRIKRNLN